MSRVLVTGASGFVGKHTVRHLTARGYDVHCLTRMGGKIPGVKCYQVDLLTEADALAKLVAGIKPQSLLHLAWTVEPGAFWTSRENLDWLAASVPLYRAFVDAGGRRMVLAGTCAEYAWSAAHTSRPLHELSSALTPATLYGQAKKSQFDILSAAAALDGVALASGRIFFLYGPDERSGRVVSDVVVNLLRGRLIETTEGTQSRDFMHVADVAGAFAALLASDVTGAVNIATGIDQPLSQLLAEIGAQIGRPDLLQFGARPMAANAPPRLAASVARLRDEVGFMPAFDLKTGLANTIGWWRRELKLDQKR